MANDITKWREYAVTIGDLKKWIAEHADVPDDTPVILQRDAEGNGYSPLSAMDLGWYRAESTWSGEVHGDDDSVTSEQVAADGDLAYSVEQGDMHQIGPEDVRCVVLGPVN